MPPKAYTVTVDGKEYTVADIAEIRKVSYEAARVDFWKFSEGKITKEQLFRKGKRTKGSGRTWTAKESGELSKPRASRRKCAPFVPGTWEAKNIPDCHKGGTLKRGNVKKD
jgi:hypothetical protein